MALCGFAAYSMHDAIVKYLNDYHTFQIIFFAMLFSYVPFSVARIIAGKQLSVRPQHPKLASIRALLHVGALCLAFSAFSTLPLVEAYVLLFCTPLIISVLAIIFLGETIALVRWVLIILGMAGIFIVLRPSLETVQLGHLMALGAAFCSAGSAVISRKIGGSENMAAMILFPMLTTISVSGAALYFIYQPMPLADLSLMFLVGALGLLGQFCVLSGFRLAPATFIGPMQYSQIIWAILFGYLFFNEAVDKWVVIGSLITVASGIAMIWRERQVSKVKAKEADTQNNEDWL